MRTEDIKTNHKIKNHSLTFREYITGKKYKFARLKTAVITLAILSGSVCSYPVVKNIYQTTSVVADSEGTVTADYLNVRTGAGTDYSILQSDGGLVRLKEGTKVTIKSTSGKWYKVTFAYNGKNLNGYVSSDYIKKSASATATIKPVPTAVSTTGVVTADYLNVRTGAGTNYSKLTIDNKNVQLKKDTKVNIISSKSGFYYVSFTHNNKTVKGYVSADYVKKTSDSNNAAKSTNTAKAVSTAKAATTTKTVTTPVTISAKVNCNSLNVRTGAGVSSTRLKYQGNNVMLDKNHSVTVTGEQSVSGVKWYKIKFTYKNKSLTGFVHGNYLNFTIPKNGLKASTSSTSAVNIKNNTSGNIMKVSGKALSLKKNTAVTVLSQKIERNTNWVIVSFKYNNATKKGYLKADEINYIYSESKKVTVTATATPKATAKAVTTATATAKATATPKATAKATATAKAVATAKATATAAPKATATATPKPDNTTGNLVGSNKPMTDAEFKKDLVNQGFPADYVNALMEVHRQHPKWIFKAYNTGLDFNTAVEMESAAGINLIPSSYNVSWLSTGQGAYVWKEDRFVVFDSPYWVTSSKAVNAYYMDPRNFFAEKYIFMFEELSYDKENHTLEGIESILKNTAMGNTKVTYKDDTTGKEVSKLYSQVFMEAAQYSGVSPYHLASRCKQEIVTGINSLSNSASGTVAGYEGLYNYYNIGASNSTVRMRAIKNGLNYAKNGTTSAKKNEQYLIPWNTRYRAIVGGAYFIGSTYIMAGQNTVYLQKFNVTPSRTYSHQYMGNVQAAWSEAAKTYTAYKSMDDYDEIPITFSIPVFKNMPSKPCSLPSNGKNPNNWLSSLKVDGCTLTPTFDVTKDQEYTTSVKADTECVNISATAASKKATVSGAGQVKLKKGVNAVSVTVTAENGDKRTYIINIVRKS